MHFERLAQMATVGHVSIEDDQIEPATAIEVDGLRAPANHLPTMLIGAAGFGCRNKDSPRCLQEQVGRFIRKIGDVEIEKLVAIEITVGDAHAAAGLTIRPSCTTMGAGCFAEVIDLLVVHPATDPEVIVDGIIRNKYI